MEIGYEKHQRWRKRYLCRSHGDEHEMQRNTEENAEQRKRRLIGIEDRTPQSITEEEILRIARLSSIALIPYGKRET